jgi:hypothetical protein
VTNATIPESTLKKKCNSICYHAVRESVAMGESLVLPATAHTTAGLQPVFEALLLGLAHVVSTCASQTNKARASSQTKRIASAESLTK